MFVKIENYCGHNYPLILNMDFISDIKPCYELSNDNDNISVNFYTLQMNNKSVYRLNQEQYEQIGKILTTRL